MEDRLQERALSAEAAVLKVTERCEGYERDMKELTAEPSQVKQLIFLHACPTTHTKRHHQLITNHCKIIKWL